MAPVIDLLVFALNLYLWIIILSVMVSWLVVFDVLNTRNRWVYKTCQLLNRATSPAILQVRKILPPLGGIDLSPMVVIFAIYLLQNFLVRLR
jgi:YggT family protein